MNILFLTGYSNSEQREKSQTFSRSASGPVDYTFLSGNQFIKFGREAKKQNKAKIKDKESFLALKPVIPLPGDIYTHSVCLIICLSCCIMSSTKAVIDSFGRLPRVPWHSLALSRHSETYVKFESLLNKRILLSSPLSRI